MVFEILFVLSLILNAFLLFYCTRIARRLFVAGTNLEVVYSMVSGFRSHVEQIHEAEMFYGDQTLQALMDHSKQILDELENYEDIMDIVATDEQLEEERDEEEKQ
jgi:hypothetical protein